MSKENNSHFNKCVIFGRISSTETKTTKAGKVFLNIVIDCLNPLYGGVQAYCRMWGDNRITNAPTVGQIVKMEGLFAQFVKNNKIVNSFTVFKWSLFTGDEFRACFILTGIISEVSTIEDEGFIKLEVNRKGLNDAPTNEKFELWTKNKDSILGLEIRQTITAKGLIAERGSSDYFGTSSGIFKAYILEIKSSVNTDEPF